MAKQYYVYIMTNKSKTLYTGVTDNLERRVYEHKKKLLGGFTKRYNITKLVYYEVTNDIHVAIGREKQIKGWLRRKKVALIGTVNPQWLDLSEGWFRDDLHDSKQNVEIKVLSNNLKMEKVLLGWSGGKDSAMALYEAQRSQKYEIVSLLTTITEDYDRVSMHGVRRTLVEQQAQSLGLPLEEVFISKSCSDEEYESKMRQTLTVFKENGVSSVIFGDIFLEGVRRYREENLAKIGMKGIFPIWGRDTAELARSFIALSFEAITTCVDSKVLDKKFIGRTLDEEFLSELPPAVDPAGENGEFHSFVFDGPIFREQIACTVGEVVLRDSFYFCDLLPKERVR